MLPRVIAICGFKRSGKDTIANYLVEKYGYKNVKIADPLKKACKAIFNLNDHQLEGNLKEVVDERWGVSPRQIMQFFGTEMMQFHIQALMPNIGRKLWISSLTHKYKDTNQRIVISDLRFRHEYEEIKACFGHDVKFIRVVRSSFKPNGDTHSSEQEWMSLPTDFHFENNSTFEELHKNVDEWLDLLANKDQSKLILRVP